jgi:hypothetical protein
LGGIDTAGTGDNNIVTFFPGNLYDVRVYNYELTPTQVATLAGVTIAPTLGIAPNGSGGFVLTWSAGSLLQSTNVSGPWTTNNAATSPFTITPNPAVPQLFYRAQAP